MVFHLYFVLFPGQRWEPKSLKHLLDYFNSEPPSGQSSSSNIIREWNKALFYIHQVAPYSPHRGNEFSHAISLRNDAKFDIHER